MAEQLIVLSNAVMMTHKQRQT